MLAERLIEWTQGLEQSGMRKGWVRGNRQGQAAMLSRLLTLRFGALSSDIQTRVMLAAPAELECWSERLLGAVTLEEVFDEDVEGGVLAAGR